MSLNTCLLYIADTDLGVFHQQLVDLTWECIETWRNLILSKVLNLIEASQQIWKASSWGINQQESLLEVVLWSLDKLFIGRGIVKSFCCTIIYLCTFFSPLVCLCVFTCNLAFYPISLLFWVYLIYACTCSNVETVVLDYWTATTAWRLEREHFTGKCHKDRSF